MKGEKSVVRVSPDVLIKFESKSYINGKEASENDSKYSDNKENELKHEKGTNKTQHVTEILSNQSTH